MCVRGFRGTESRWKSRYSPLHPLFVGEVGGLDAGRPLDAETVRALGAAIDRYAVLVLRGQNLDDERQMAFARHFGELELPRSGRADVSQAVAARDVGYFQP